MKWTTSITSGVYRVFSSTGESSNKHTMMSMWEKIWQEGVAPGERFDAGQVEPCLAHLIEQDVLPTGRGLVPGCGRGYALAALARSGSRRMLGIDISPTGVAEANKFLKSQDIPADRARIEEADFFEYTCDPSERFDLLYDSTFFTALDPSLRRRWAEKVAELVKPGGELVALNFPVADFEGGPPFALNLEEFAQLMQSVGFSKIMVEKVPDERIARRKFGDEYIARWKHD